MSETPKDSACPAKEFLDRQLELAEHALQVPRAVAKRRLQATGALRQSRFQGGKIFGRAFDDAGQPRLLAAELLEEIGHLGADALVHDIERGVERVALLGKLVGDRGAGLCQPAGSLVGRGEDVVGDLGADAAQRLGDAIA